jgi:transposase
MQQNFLIWGVAQTTAATIVSELGSLSRFTSPRQLMGYSGLVASEHSSGGKVQRGRRRQLFCVNGQGVHPW